MSAPALKDLPKVATDLKSQLEGFNTEQLKNASTQEKVILPSAEEIKQEKQHMSLLKDVEDFSATGLKHTETVVKVSLPTAEGLIKTVCHELQRVCTDFNAKCNVQADSL